MLENLIIGIVVMVLSVIGQSIIGIVETLYSSYFSGAIEYGLSDSDNQRRMRHSSIIIVTLLFVLSYVFLMTSSLVVVYVINKLDNKLTDILIIVISGFCTFFSIFYLHIEKKEPVVKKYSDIFLWRVYISFYLLLCAIYSIMFVVRKKQSFYYLFLLQWQQSQRYS